MEGVRGSLSNSSLFVKGEVKMQLALGFLIATCIALAIALYITWTKLNSKTPIKVQNVIHLGLKDGRITTGLTPTTLSVRPEDFQVRADKLREALMKQFETEDHPDISVRAYCILKQAGVREMLDPKSASEAEKVLTRLLVNEDSDAVRRFLETLADSIANATATADNTVVAK